MVGDTLADMGMGRSAKLRGTIGVLSGVAGKEDLRPLADHLVIKSHIYSHSSTNLGPAHRRTYANSSWLNKILPIGNYFHDEFRRKNYR